MDVEHREVIVVGAGPAGTSCAQRLAEENIDVLILERRAIVGNPAQCGECIPIGEKWLVRSTESMITRWLKRSFEFPTGFSFTDLTTCACSAQWEIIQFRSGCVCWPSIAIRWIPC